MIKEEARNGFERVSFLVERDDVDPVVKILDEAPDGDVTTASVVGGSGGGHSEGVNWVRRIIGNRVL